MLEALDGITTIITAGPTALPFALPDPDPVQPPGTDAISDILGWAKWVGLVIAIFGIIIVAAIMSVNSRRGQGSDNLGTLGYIFMGVVLIGASTALVGFISGA